MQLPKRARGALIALALAAGALAVAPAAGAEAAGHGLDWRQCGDRFECAELEVPLDYSRPHWRTIEIPVLRLPATDPKRRIGTIVGGAGGPGQSGIDLVRSLGTSLFAPLNDRFDLVTFDQRGIGMIDCGPLPEADPGWAEPHDVDAQLIARNAREIGRRCLKRNPVALPYVTTGNAARDIDRLRAALGEKQISYIGGSYGTMLGATYSSLFPGRLRAMALDAPVDVDGWVNRPLDDTREQIAGFENSLDRFAMHCVASPACGFGGDDPMAAIDALLERLDRDPLPVPGQPGTMLDGDLLRLGLAGLMYAPSLWPATATMLGQLEQGAVTDLAIQLIGLDLFGIDVSAFWAINAADRDHPRGVQPYLDAVRHTWGTADHFWSVGGYSAARFGFWPVEGRGAYRGPISADIAVQPLIFAVRHDPATPYRWGQRLARDLDARLLTVHGDGHGSLGNPCMMQLTERYLEDLEVPPPGVTCSEPKPFPTAASAAVRGDGLKRLIRRERRSALLGMPVPALLGR